MLQDEVISGLISQIFSKKKDMKLAKRIHDLRRKNNSGA